MVEHTFYYAPMIVQNGRSHQVCDRMTVRGGDPAAARSATMPPMSMFLRVLLFGGALLVTAMFVLAPDRWRQWGRRLRIVGFAYVAAVLISTVLRLMGVVDWS